MSDALPPATPENLALLLQRLSRAGWVAHSAVSVTHHKGQLRLTEVGMQRVAELMDMLHELGGLPSNGELLALWYMLPTMSGRKPPQDGGPPRARP